MLTGGQLLGRCLENLGVREIWGTSGHSNVAAIDGLLDTKIRYLSVRHEQVAAHAADGYFRAVHRPGVILVHNGPGLTNALTGIGDAASDCSAVVVIAGDVALRHEGRDAFQEISLHADASQGETFRPLVKRAWRVHTLEALPRVLVKAFTLATTGRPGPVLVSVPMDLLSRRGEFAPPDLTAHRPTGTRPRGDAVEIARAARLLVEAERPVLHAGGGAILAEAAEPLRALAEHLGALVTTTMAGKGAMPESHPLAAGTTGRAGTPVANAAAAGADVLLALGTQFPEQDSSSWTPGFTFSIPPTRLIHVDVDAQQLGKIYPLEIGIVGDARAVLEDLRAAVADLVPPRDWRESPRIAAVARDKAAWLGLLALLQTSAARPIRPERVLATVRSVLPAEGIIVGDVGWGKNGVSQQYLVERPQTVFVASGYGTMGFAAAAALGARVARPETPVVSLTGDGGLSSVLSALVTAVEHDVGVVWVVFNNAAYGAIADLQRHHFGRGAGGDFVRADTGEPYALDFAALARACGAAGRRVTQPDDLRPALEDALASGRPAVLDVVVERQAAYQPTGYWDVGDIYAGR